LNNRPEPGQSELQLYRRASADSLKYEIPPDFRGEDRPVENAIWQFYVEAMGLPEETQREGVTIDATGWDADSRKVGVTVTVEQADAEDVVPPPFACTFDVTSNEIEMTPESAEALKREAQSGDAEQSDLQANRNELLEGNFPGERFPVTRARLLSESEVSNWSLSNVGYAINEIYARRGADFSDEQETKRQFAKMPWYHPRPELSRDQIEAEFSSVEKQNMELLAKLRDAKQKQERRRAVRGRPVATPKPGEEFFRAFLREMSGARPDR
jgi:hypothetical protein